MSWLIGWLLLVRTALAAVFPQPVGYVNDFAGIISPAVEARLEADLEAFSASTSNELAVVTLNSLEGDTIENAAVSLFEQWGIGQKDKDNGVLFLIAPHERQTRIEAGYGLEPVLTDARAGRIIRDVITPKFKQNDYDAGINDGVTAIIAVLEGGEPITASSGQAEGWMVLVIIFVIVIIVIWLVKRREKRRFTQGKRSWWGGLSSGKSGGGFGGFSGGRSGGGGASGGW